MAISKILHMKDSGNSFHARHLKRALDYVMNPEKTQGGRLVGAINCQTDMAFEQMMDTKKQFGKTDKRQGYHIILSFKEDEVEPDRAFEITQKFVAEYLGDAYEAVFVVHDNTDHVHSHIVFNSVSFVDGKKYRYTDNYVNPLEMDVWSLDPNDSKGMVREKGEFMLGLCEQCIGDSLNSRQKSIIDRCVRKLYIDIARSKEKYIPVMSDFYDILMAQPEDEAKDIALSLELFVNGSLNIFNHQTNVDVDNRFTVYGIRDLGTELSPITMLVMMESIQNRIVENGKRGKATWLYIDEFHVLLNSEYSAKYLQQLWKKVRKQGGLCTGITQNVVDLLQNYTATTMLANSEFVALLKQANTDSSKMAEVIGVSEAQLRFVTNTASGMGLIKCGSVVIPFDNQISKDTDLYRLYNTNIHEKIAEQKKKEAMLQ